jgi:hypothetical protein
VAVGDRGAARRAVRPGLGGLRRRDRYAAHRAVPGNNQGRTAVQGSQNAAREAHHQRCALGGRGASHPLEGAAGTPSGHRAREGGRRTMADGSPYRPNTLSRDWLRARRPWTGRSTCTACVITTRRISLRPGSTS